MFRHPPIRLELRVIETNYGGQLILEFIEYALVFTIIAECNTLFHNSENYIQTSAEVVLTLLGILMATLLVLIYGLRSGKAFIYDLKDNYAIWGTVFACVVVFFVANVTRIGGTHAVRKYVFSFVLFFPLAYTLFRLYRLAGRPNEVFYKHANIICFIAILNLMVYSCVTLNPNVVQVQMTQTRWGGLSHLKTWSNYLNVCVVTSASRNVLGFSIYRNYGFTTEPLMYSIQLVTALYTEMFLRPQQQRKVWKMILLVAAIFTTQSTLGLLITVVTVGLKLFVACRDKGKRPLFLPIAIAVIALVFVLIRQKQETGASSFTVHMEHYRASLEAFLHHPLIGIGYVNDQAVVAFVKDAISARDQGLSNSVAVILAEGGILLSGICMTPFIVLFCQSRKHNSTKNTAFWAVGPFSLYCLTIVHFHMLLLLFMAFGYATLEIRRTEEQKRQIILADDGEVAEAKEIGKKRKPLLVTFAMIALVTACEMLMLFSTGVWKTVFVFLKSNQLLFGQSTWKVYCFSLFLILSVIVIKFWLNTIEKKERLVLLKETAFFILYSTTFLCLYPSLYSWVSTAFGSIRFLGDVIETFILALLYFGMLFAVWLIFSVFSVHKKLAVVGCVCLVIFGLLFSGLTVKRILRVEVDTDSVLRCLAKAKLDGNGKLYANENPAAWKSRVSEIEYCGASYGAFAVMENASVVAAHNNILSELLEIGYEVTELSEECILYSNDKAFLASLNENGYPTYMYYPFQRNTEDGSADTLKRGKYTLTAGIRLLSSASDLGEPVCQISVTANNGKTAVLCQDIFPDQFDSDGNYEAAIPFSAGDWEGMEYTLLAENESAVQLAFLVIKETPTDIVRTEFDGRHQVILESFYDIEGNPYPKGNVYYAIARKYDRMGRVIELDYLGEEGEPVSIGSGYASMKREYNVYGQVIQEDYFDEAGQACVIQNGYASIERKYNKKRQLIKESYYSDNARLCMIPQGYAYFTREYDDVGNVSYQRYYDVSGHLTTTVWGYAVLYREYNDARKIVYEAYFGTEEEPVASLNGAASVRIEYQTDGEESDRTYYDTQGKVVYLEG